MALFGPMFKGESNFEAFLDGTISFFGCDVSTIRQYAFYNCSGLKKVYLGNVSSIGTNAFYNCLNLEEVDISGATSPFSLPSSNTIPNNANLKIYTSAKQYANFHGKENWALYGDKVVNKDEDSGSIDNFLYKTSTNAVAVQIVKGEAVDATTTATKVRSNLFRNYANNIKLDMFSLTEVQSNAFYNASKVVLDAPNLTCVGAYAFYNIATASLNLCNLQNASSNMCRLTNVFGSNFENLQRVGDCAFEDTTGWDDVPDLTKVSEVGYASFEGSDIKYINSSVGVSSFGVSSFQGSRLEQINISNNASVNQETFYDCLYLTTLKNNNHTGLDLSCIPCYLFYNCRNLSIYTLTSNATSIEDGAFCNVGADVNNFGYLVMPYVTTFGCYSFSNISGGTLVLEAAPSNIGSHAFAYSNIPGLQIPQSSSVVVEDSAFRSSIINCFGSSFRINISDLGAAAFRNITANRINVGLTYNNASSLLTPFTNIPDDAFYVNHINTSVNIVLAHQLYGVGENGLRNLDRGLIIEGDDFSVWYSLTGGNNAITNTSLFFQVSQKRYENLNNSSDSVKLTRINGLGRKSSNYSITFCYPNKSQWFTYSNGAITYE